MGTYRLLRLGKKIVIGKLLGSCSKDRHTCEVQLDLEPDVDVGAVDGRGPPEREPSVGDLIQPETRRTLYHSLEASLT